MPFLNNKIMYTIQQKNDIVERLKGHKHFYSDLYLFQQTFPRHNLNRELARVNEYNMDRLSSQMIYILLDVVSESSIVANRSSQKKIVASAAKAPAKPKAAKTPAKLKANKKNPKPQKQSPVDSVDEPPMLTDADRDESKDPEGDKKKENQN